MIKDEKYADAVRAMNAERTCATGGRFGRGSYGSYQTFGDLNLNFGSASEPATNYRRSLDIGDAVAGSTYQVGSDISTREFFSSAVDRVLVMRIVCSRNGAVSFSAKLGRIEFAETIPAGVNTVVMTGISTGSAGDLGFEAQVRVLTKAGSVSASRKSINVQGADEALVLLTAGTDHILDYAKAYKGPDPHESVSAAMKQAS